jgi:PAS domain-containing protein
MTWEYLIALKIFIAKSLLWLGGLASIILAWFGVYKKIYLPYKMNKKHSEEAQAVFFSDLRGLLTDVKMIKDQVLPNGGQSLNDKVTHLGDKALLIDQNIKIVKARQKFMIKVSETPTFWCDIYGNVVYANNSLINLFGADSEDQLKGHAMMDFIDYSDHGRILSRWNDAMKNNTEAEIEYTVINGKTKERYPVRSRTVFEREGGDILTICGTVTRIK